MLSVLGLVLGHRVDERVARARVLDEEAANARRDGTKVAERVEADDGARDEEDGGQRELSS